MITVRAQEDKQALAENESFEKFHPTFTYPVRASPRLSAHNTDRNEIDIRGRRKDIWLPGSSD